MNNHNILRSIIAFAFLLTVGIVSFCPHIADAVTLYEQHNLVSDISGVADYLDSNLVNPWGITSSSTSPFWISDNNTGVSTIYNGSGQPNALIVTIPPPSGGTSPSSPTGVVFNGSSDFSGAHFIFATEDGTIAGWTSGTVAALKVDNSGLGAVYTGLAIGSNISGNFLYAANFSTGTIDVYDTNYNQAFLAGSFTDPNLPAGYAPFNIKNIGGKLYVTYALQDTSKQDAVAGAGNGIVDVYDTNGNLLQRLVSQGGYLNAPWGIVLAPSIFGDFSNELLIGNFGDGSINAFDPLTGNFIGQMLDSMGNPLSIEGLWGLIVGNGGNGGDVNTLYFTAGISGGGNIEDHGLFGSLHPIPEPSTILLLGIGLAGGGLLRRRFNN